MNCVPMSETTVLGVPLVEKILSRAVRIVPLVDDLSGMTSGHNNNEFTATIYGVSLIDLPCLDVVETIVRMFTEKELFSVKQVT